MEYEAKVIFIGDSNVGKTCIIKRCTSNEFLENATPTLSSNYSLISIKTAESNIRIQFWDTAGDEKYRSIVPMFYRGSQAAVIVYSIDDRKTFQDIDYFIESLKANLDFDSLALFLIANKLDLEDRTVTALEGEEKAKSINATFMEVSAKNGENISEFVNMIAIEINEKKKMRKSEKLHLNQNQQTNDICC